MDSGMFGLLFTIVVFGTGGLLGASRRSRPAGPLMYVALLALAAIGSFIGVDTRLVSLGGFAVFLNWAIVSSCVGGCLGLLLRNNKLRRLQSP